MVALYTASEYSTNQQSYRENYYYSQLEAMREEGYWSREMEETFAEGFERFVWEGKTYTFKVVEPTWNQKNTLLSKCMSASSSGKPELNLAKYNEEMLMLVMRDSDGLFEIDALEFKRFSDKFGEALDKQIIPNPFTTKHS